MDAGAGSGAMGRFAELQGESLGSQQAYTDALRLTGLPVDIEMIESDRLPFLIPMRYSLDQHLIEVNVRYPDTRAIRVQQMVEELFHAIDHLGHSFTLSAASPLFDIKRGAVMTELENHYKAEGYFKEFFNYPLHVENNFKDDRIKAEVFARLGVLYFAHPEVLKRELLKAYEVYHELFGLSKNSPVSDQYIRSKIWAVPRGIDQVCQRQATMEAVRTSHWRSIGAESASELGRLRQAIAQVLKSPVGGKKADL